MTPDGQRGGVLRILVSDENGSPASAPGLARWLEGVAPVRAQGFVGVALVGDARVRALNKRYRKRDYATDVLSFSYGASSLVGPQFFSSNPYQYLGDIVIARGVARRQARAAGHSERTELRVLALHGLLHLLGYDHERDGGAMARVERALRLKGGLPSGLIERGRPVLNTRKRSGVPLRPLDPSTHPGSPRARSRGESLRAVPSGVEGRQAQGGRGPRANKS